MKRALSILLAVLLMLAAVPTFAEEGGLQAGLYASETGAEFMYLNEEGVGVLNYMSNGMFSANGVVWTETALEIERTAVPFELKEGILSFTYDEVSFALQYSKTWDAFALGDQGTAFAGDYVAENGKKMTLAADGKGTFDGKPIFWGSLVPYWKDSAKEGDCFILFDSYLGGMAFADGKVTVATAEDEEILFSPVEPPKVEEVPEAAVMTLISPTFDLGLTLPTDKWTVEETDAGLVITREKDLIQYTLLSVPLEKEPSAATLDAYADLVWKDALMGAGVAYDAAETVRGDRTVGTAAGRTAATDWTRENGAECLGDAILWYANGRLYVALCASNADTRAEALAILDEALLSLRTAEEVSQTREILLPVEKGVLDEIRELPPVAPVTEKVYYGYRVTSNGQTYDLVPILVLIGLDPKTFSLTLRSDGTGKAVLMDETSAMDFTWTEEAFNTDEENIPYTREGEHILITIEGDSMEFAPAAEIETLLAELENEKKEKIVVPTAEDLIGTWTFTKTRIMGMEIPADEKDTSKSLVLNEDGSVVFLTEGAPVEYEWKIQEDGKMLLTMADAEEYLLTYNGKELKLNMGAEGMEMIFEKTN